MEDKSTANRFPWVNEQWKHQQKTSNQPKLQHIPSRFPCFLDELVENSKKSSTPIQVTPNLHAVVSSPSGTLAPTSRQGASAGATRCGSFVLNKKFEVASLHPVVSVMLSFFSKMLKTYGKTPCICCNFIRLTRTCVIDPLFTHVHSLLRLCRASSLDQ